MTKVFGVTLFFNFHCDTNKQKTQKKLVKAQQLTSFAEKNKNSAQLQEPTTLFRAEREYWVNWIKLELAAQLSLA